MENTLRRLLDEKPNEWKKSAYWTPFVCSMKFFTHFIFLMLLMYCGAFVFALLEDPEVFYQMQPTHPSSTSQPINDSGTASNIHVRNVSQFWDNIESKYDVKLDSHLREEVYAFWKIALEEKVSTEKEEDSKKRLDRSFIINKWFYFITISITTIGYGHVHPVTDNGKIFYIFFSIIGIAMMMSLLKSLGAILNAINKKVCSAISKCFFKDKRFVSAELMSVLSITMMFFVFMLLVIWHDQAIGESEHWKLVDTIYYWIVTFTTVGFGDVHFSLDEEINHMYEMLFYRMCGLSFLAGIIDSIQKYMKFRRKMLEHRSKRSLTQIRELIGNRVRKPLEFEETEPK